ncbi:hypothetical protein [Streptomyces sp. DH12]|uniref:hypothetical protein n=1 Tax=Streptomyces sp. DH12 TaxID=2857010 RepID=UPI001E4AD8A4|nr:hypothetical protein [Streptomyces sp. DH12]
MTYTIKQGKPDPLVLHRGQTSTFNMRAGLTPLSPPVEGREETFAVTFPKGTRFPKGGRVRYFTSTGDEPESRPELVGWNAQKGLLLFKHRVHLNDGTPQQNGFYSVDIQAPSDAPTGDHQGSLKIALETAPLRVRILADTPPQDAPGTGDGGGTEGGTEQ